MLRKNKSFSEVEMNIINSTILITRKCNMRCSYCRVRKEKPKNELSTKQWLKVFDILKKLKVGFNVILGGEPTMLNDGLCKIVRYCNKNQIPYAVSTNSVVSRILRDKLLNSRIKNWSISFDTVDTRDTVIDTDVFVKSSVGFQNLLYMKNAGVPDLHATITVTKKNLHEVPGMVSFLSKMGVWAEITAIHFSKGKGYDLFPKKEEIKELCFTKDDQKHINTIIEVLKRMKKDEKYMIHNDIEYFDAFKKYAIDLDWKCSKLFSLCIDSDGTMRTCLHYNGKHCKKFSIFDLEDEEKLKEFEKAWKKDRLTCKNCFWDCWVSAENQIKKVGTEEAKKAFQHKQGALR